MTPKGDAKDGGDGKDPARAGGGGPADGASSDESGYRRDDYWRKAQEDLPADVESEPAHGQSFETPEERAEAERERGAEAGESAAEGADGGADAPEHEPPHAKG